MNVIGKKEARPAVGSKRASVCEDDGSIPQAERERGMRLLWVPFALLLAAYAAWEVLL